MNAMSPAPISTPSRAKTTPAAGSMPTNHGHSRWAWWSTAGDDVNACGISTHPAAYTTLNAHPAHKPYRVTCHAMRRAVVSSLAPSAAPTSDCAAMANESSSKAVNSHSCKPIWWAAICAVPIRDATPAALRNAIWNAADRRTRSRPSTSWERMTVHCGRTDELAAVQRSKEQPAADDLCGHVRDRRTVESEMERVDKDRRGGGRQRVGEQHDAHGLAGLLHTTHPAVAREDEQHARHAEHGDTEPRLGRVLRVRVAAGQQPDRRMRQQLAQADHDDADDHRQPGCLYPFVDRGVVAAGTEPSRGPAGRAVLDERAESSSSAMSAPPRRVRPAAPRPDGPRPRCRPGRTGARRRARRTPTRRARAPAASKRQPSQSRVDPSATGRGRHEAPARDQTARYIMCRSTSPSVGCRKPCGTVPIVVKPRS